MIEQIILIGMSIILYPVFLQIFNYCHESCHKEIYRKRGIISNIEHNILCTKWSCSALIPKNKTKQAKECNNSHDTAEIISYHLKPIFAFIMLAFIILITILVIK